MIISVVIVESIFASMYMVRDSSGELVMIQSFVALFQQVTLQFCLMLGCHIKQQWDSTFFQPVLVMWDSSLVYC